MHWKMLGWALGVRMVAKGRVPRWNGKGESVTEI